MYKTNRNECLTIYTWKIMMMSDNDKKHKNLKRREKIKKQNSKMKMEWIQLFATERK